MIASKSSNTAGLVCLHLTVLVLSWYPILEEKIFDVQDDVHRRSRY